MKVDASRLSRLFEDIARAADDGRHHEALRFADSARRHAPDHPVARLIYARSLLQEGNAAAAAGYLKGRDDSDSLLLYVEAALDAGLIDESAAACRRLLARHAVDAFPSLAALAGRLCRDHGERFAGWMGIDSRQCLVGELTTGRSATINWGDAALAQIVTGLGETAFEVDLPANLAGVIRVTAAGREFLGSGLVWPVDFGVAGFVLLEDRELTGEVSIDWHPTAPIPVVVAPGRSETRYLVEAGATARVGRPFSWQLDDLTLDHASLEVGVLLPDGSVRPLPGSPIKQPQPKPRPIAALPPWVPRAAVLRDAPLVNIVVPVYAGRDETLKCLRSVLATLPARLALITVVDDASPDHELRADLEEMAASRRITLVRNPLNMGFPGAVNRGMRVHPERDVILLNADTEVFPGWLERLRVAAYRDDGVGTVTPLGEAASIVSFGQRDAQPLSSVAGAEVDQVARTVNTGLTFDIPVGVGFCMYIRRQCLDEIGDFDEHSFGRGYGEENDFCLRARRRGWRHVAAADVFVRHSGGRSFGRTKAALQARNERVINLRHPGYDACVAAFVAADPLRLARRDIDRQRLLAGVQRPILLVTLALGGGVKRHVDERRRALEARGHTVLELHVDGTVDAKDKSQLRLEALNLAHLVYDRALELEPLRALLSEAALTEIEIHHFLGLTGPVLELLRGLDVPYRVIVHDYSWVCPRVSLLNGAGVYCGEPAVDVCETCVQQNGSALGESLTVAALRERSAQLLGGAVQVLSATEDVRARLARYFPLVPIDVVPWEPAPTVQRRPRRRREGPFRVLLIGALGGQKGASILTQCARDAAARDLALEFVVIGYAEQNPALLETDRIFMSGPYEEHEVPALLDREDCDVALFPNVGPETWCYTLTHVLARGMPIVAFDLGAVAERLRNANTGVLLPWDTAAAVLNDELLRVAAEQAEELIVDAVGSTTVTDTDQTTVEPLSTVQVLNLPIGFYAFTVQSGAAVATGGLMLPALQVSPAPARGMGQVEFMSGPSTLDRWLTASGDVVTVKISGGDAALLLTSVRAPDSGVLSIDVKRLDGPAAADEPAATVAVPARAADTRVITLVHLPYLGDLTFVEGWAGKPQENLWIEGFSVVVEEPNLPRLLEYCGVSEEGEVSDWLSGGDLCGARGTGVPLVAFAVRIKPDAMPQYTCQYSGRFLSGDVIGPFDDGRFCRSESPGDPLVAMELRIAPDPSGGVALRS